VRALLRTVVFLFVRSLYTWLFCLCLVVPIVAFSFPYVKWAAGVQFFNLIILIVCKLYCTLTFCLWFFYFMLYALSRADKLYLQYLGEIYSVRSCV